MDHRKAVNNEILDIMIKYALIERYTEEVNALRRKQMILVFLKPLKEKWKSLLILQEEMSV